MTQLVFLTNTGENKKVDLPKFYFQMPWAMINDIKKNKDAGDQNYYFFEISTKDHRVLNFRVYDPYKNYHKRLSDLHRQYNTFNDLYCFRFKACTNLEQKHQGWNVFNLENEYRRQGLDFEVEKDLTFNILLLSQGVRWRLVRNYKTSYENLCDSYPEFLMIPSNINPINLQIAIKFRSKNRFPVMTYHWANTALPRGFATLWRSAQCNVSPPNPDWLFRPLDGRRVLPVLSPRPDGCRGHQRLQLE